MEGGDNIGGGRSQIPEGRPTARQKIPEGRAEKGDDTGGRGSQATLQPNWGAEYPRDRTGAIPAGCLVTLSIPMGYRGSEPGNRAVVLEIPAGCLVVLWSGRGPPTGVLPALPLGVTLGATLALTLPLALVLAPAPALALVLVVGSRMFPGL